MIRTKEQLRNRIEEIAESRMEKLPYSTELKFNIAMNRKQPIWKRIKAFWKGENDLGRGVGRFLDVFLLFSPKIKTGRQLAKSILIKQNTMPKRVKPYFTQKSTWEGIAAILGAIGITIYPEAILEIVAGVFAIIGGIELWREEAEDE